MKQLVNRLLSQLFMLMIINSSMAINYIDTDSVQVDFFNKQAWEIRNSNPELAKKYACKAIIIANKKKYLRGLSFSFNVLGHFYKLKVNYKRAYYYYQRSLNIRKVLGDKLQIAKSYRNIMSVFKLWGKYKLAIQTGSFALQLLTFGSDTSAMEVLNERASLQTNLAGIYIKTGDYTNALKAAIDGKKIFIKLDDHDGLASANMTIGNIYKALLNYSKAIHRYQEAIKIYKESDNQRELAKCYNNIGSIYYEIHQNRLAKDYFGKSISIKEKNQFDDDLFGTLFNLGIIYESNNQSDSAFYCYNKCLKLANLSNNNEALYESHRALGLLLSEQKKNTASKAHLVKALTLSVSSAATTESLVLLQGLAHVYMSEGNTDSAIFYNNQFNALNDSINEVIRHSLFLDAAIKEKEQELQIIHIESRNQLLIITSLIIFVLFLVIIIVLIHRWGINKRKLLELRTQIKEQELIELDGMILGQENERKRLSKELHDTIGSILSATKFAFKSMENSIEKLLDENKVQYKKINLMLDDALENVRRISHDMASGILVEKGLEKTLLQLFEIFEHAGNLKITLDMTGFNDKKIAYDVELNLYRIIQELLTNVLKHAEAKNVSVQLLKSEAKETITLMLLDDGKGFDANDIKAKKGIGLDNITQRVKSLSGELSIDSGRGSGTTITIKVPLNN